MKLRMEDKNLKALSLEDLDGVAGGQDYSKEWEEWTREWKEWWIYYYGDARCGNCGRYLNTVIKDYDRAMAYDVYMNNAFMCKCGQVIRPVNKWR